MVDVKSFFLLTYLIRLIAAPSVPRFNGTDGRVGAAIAGSTPNYSDNDCIVYGDNSEACNTETNIAVSTEVIVGAIGGSLGGILLISCCVGCCYCYYREH